ncbi:hypothetical protein D3C80_1840900 [compost metagenome]
MDSDRRAGKGGEKAIELGQVDHRVIVAVSDQQVFKAVEFFFAEGAEHRDYLLSKSASTLAQQAPEDCPQLCCCGQFLY